ncbi:unnamed protein product [Arabis nemorensis]|uniref:Uncharacterized protein n=1 Tax=Arabis nemorensis TaxID=586526 RepID=A0A565BJC9_9BRAS|nr:unnamed protein product [Arabis nemorensis]
MTLLRVVSLHDEPSHVTKATVLRNMGFEVMSFLGDKESHSKTEKKSNLENIKETNKESHSESDKEVE